VEVLLWCTPFFSTRRDEAGPKAYFLKGWGGSFFRGWGCLGKETRLFLGKDSALLLGRMTRFTFRRYSTHADIYTDTGSKHAAIIELPQHIGYTTKRVAASPLAPDLVIPKNHTAYSL